MVPLVPPPWSGPAHTAQQARLQTQQSQLLLLAGKQKAGHTQGTSQTT